MDALILFSHGSLLCGSGEALEAHAARLRERGDFPIVEIGYLNYSQPSFALGVERAVAQGATRIVIVPYFLIAGYFVTTSLPEKLEPLRKIYPQIEFVVAEAFKQDTSLADALFDAATTTARTHEHWRDPLRRAALSCRPFAECPLYGTPACPKMPAPPDTDAVAAE